MFPLQPLQAVDYLVIGHIATDETEQGLRLGGTASYAALTARALGLRPGIVTSWGAEIKPRELTGIPIVSYPADKSTTFINQYNDQGRIQTIKSVAPAININIIPEPWFKTPIVHLAPIAQEIEPTIVRSFPESLIGATLQGWLRSWDDDGIVHISEWPEANFVLQKISAAVLSIEDINNNENRIEEMVSACDILAVTEASRGSRVYWHGDVRRFVAPQISEVDATGAGDIYAAAFFTRYHQTNDPWEAGRFATQLATYSITRPGLQSIPTGEEIQACIVEVY